MTTGIMPISYLDGAADGIVSYNGAQYLYGSVSLQAHNWTLYALVSYQFVIQRTGDIVRVAVVACCRYRADCLNRPAAFLQFCQADRVPHPADEEGVQGQLAHRAGRDAGG